MEDHAEGLAPAADGMREVETSLPLSPAQLGVYFEHLRDGSGRRFNIGQVTTIAGDLDIEAFRAAAAAVIERTPALNLAVVTTQDKPRQVFVDRSAVVVPLHDLRENPDPEAVGLDLPKETLDQQPKLVMSNSSGFGGANVSIVFSQPDL